jgi:ABC-type uncharacterized transport system YnjBCD substrate-binding protein
VDKWGNILSTKKNNGLYGPWTDKLPNAKNIDFKNPFIGTDFQQQINGFELPGETFRWHGFIIAIKLKIHLKQEGN